MARLSHAGMDALNRAILEIHEPATLAQLDSRVFSAARRMLSHDVACITFTHAKGNEADFLFSELVQDVLIGVRPHLPEYFKMPGVGDGRRNASMTPSSFLDFTTRRQWESSAFYQYGFRQLGVYHDVIAKFHRYPNGALCTLTLARKSGAYTQEERLMLQLFAPHLGQRYRQLIAAEADHPVFSQGLPMADQDWLLCADSGRVLSFGPNVPGIFLDAGLRLGQRLPHHWRDWLALQLAPTNVLAPRPPLVVKAPGMRLVVHCLANSHSRQHHLILRKAPADDRVLSPRETEVAQWLAAGKTNPEIADICGISRGTVKIHVERILQKLGVENRTGAALQFARKDAGECSWARMSDFRS